MKALKVGALAIVVAVDVPAAAQMDMTDHETTPDGLDYVARTTIVVPDKGVEMTVENFSYQREQ